MDLVTRLLDRMDAWRHFPNYQLERRADLLFSLYLPQVVQQKTGVEIAEPFVPEFPVRIGTIYDRVPIDKSYKIDYVLVSRSGKEAFLVELKTDGASRRDTQDRYLVASEKAGMEALLDGVLQIFRATQSKRKYYCLLRHLETMGQIRIPQKLHEIMARPNLQGANEASESIVVTSKVKKSRILYVQPNGEGDGVISFEEFARTIETGGDPVSKRFARSLREWAEVTAGQPG